MSLMFGSGLVLDEQRWPEFVSIATAKHLSVQYSEQPDRYQIYAIDGSIVYVCEIFTGVVPQPDFYTQGDNNAHKAAFETHHKNEANSPINPRTGEGRPVLAPSWESTENLDPQWAATLHTAVAGAYSIFDQVVTDEIKLRGGWYALMTPGQAVIGDYVEFSVVDKDDVLGYFGYYGIPPGGVLELKKYVKRDYVVPSLIGDRQSFVVGGAFPVVAGLYLRTAYKSTGALGVQFKTVLLSYE